jgi:chromate transporter
LADEEPPTSEPGAGSVASVFFAALRLGCSSFGGPIAHLAYFERCYVERRRWLTREDYAGIVALCQLLPGPTSSQVGLLVGWHRAGWRGGLASWIGFTLPSALLMFGFALFEAHSRAPMYAAVLHGLQLVALAVVAHAVWSMAGKLCPDWRRRAIAIVVAIVLALAGNALLQFCAILGSGIAGWLLCRTLRLPTPRPVTAIDARTAGGALALFFACLALLPILAAQVARSPVALAEVFYRSGALVFGGGHVVLPLLRDGLVGAGWMSDTTFLNGYGAAQALPGPLFTIAAYLGAVSAPGGPSAALWACAAVLSIFLPGLLLAVAGVWLWRIFALKLPGSGAVLAGINAGVVGLLAAMLYEPLGVTAIHSPTDLLIAGTGFALLARRLVAPLWVVLGCVGSALLSGWYAA